MIVLAGDIGGTNARLALYSVQRSAGNDASKLQLDAVREHTYPSKSHPSLELIVEDFLNEARTGGQAREITRACLGIAGPVENNICRATNLPWVVDGQRPRLAPRHRAGHAAQRLSRRRAGGHRRSSRRT